MTKVSGAPRSVGGGRRITPRADDSGSWTPPNKRMHPTADTRDVILSRGSGRRVMRSVRPLLWRRREPKGWSQFRTKENGCTWREGRGLVHRVVPPVALDEWGALRVISLHHRGLTSACTRPPTRRLSSSSRGAGRRVMRGVRCLRIAKEDLSSLPNCA
jgi:hypothetical protein